MVWSEIVFYIIFVHSIDGYKNINSPKVLILLLRFQKNDILKTCTDGSALDIIKSTTLPKYNIQFRMVIVYFQLKYLPRNTCTLTDTAFPILGAQEYIPASEGRAS